MIRATLVSAVLSAALAGAALAQAEPAPEAAPPASPPAPVRAVMQVAGDVYRFQSDQHFGVFLETAEGIVVVDPINLPTAEWLAGELATRFPGVPVTHVIYSHHHWDHAAGAAAFPGAIVLAEAAAADALAGPAPETPLSPQQQAQDRNGDGKLGPDEVTGPVAANFARGDEDGDGMLTAREAFLAQYADVVRPTATFDAPYELSLGGKTIELIPVGGAHAPDMTFVLFTNEYVLFVVDVISIRRLPFMNLPGYDEADQMALFDKALMLDFETVVPGHGSIGVREDVIDHQLYYVELQAGVQAGIDAGESLEEIQATLTLDEYKDWGSYDAWRTLNIAGMYEYLIGR